MVPRWPNYRRAIAHLLLVRPFLWAVFGINVRGGEQLRELRQFVLISNHNSHLDTPILYSALPWKHVLNTRPVAAHEYFSKSPVLFKVVEFLFRPVWIDRNGYSNEAMQKMQQALDNGHSLILFPEGTRGDPGVLRDFRSGIGRLVADRPNLAVVPSFLDGPERALPKRSSIPVPLWNQVTIAPVQHVVGTAKEISSALAETVARLGEESAQARLRRPRKRTVPHCTAVLGTDGSGKSTLASRLTRSFSGNERCCLIGDELQVFEDGALRPMQPLVTDGLRRWMSRRAKSSGSLTKYKVPKLAELLLRDHLLDEAGRWYRPGSLYVDGMPLLNLCAWSALYRPEALTETNCAKILTIMTRTGEPVADQDPVYDQFPEMKLLRRLGLGSLRLPSAVIFLDVPPRVCVDRIASRGEARQVHETEEKLTALRTAYLLVCRVLENQWGLPVAIIDGNRPIEEVSEVATSFVSQTREQQNVS